MSKGWGHWRGLAAAALMVAALVGCAGTATDGTTEPPGFLDGVMSMDLAARKQEAVRGVAQSSRDGRVPQGEIYLGSNSTGSTAARPTISSGVGAAPAGGSVECICGSIGTSRMMAPIHRLARKRKNKGHPPFGTVRRGAGRHRTGNDRWRLAAPAFPPVVPIVTIRSIRRFFHGRFAAAVEEPRKGRASAFLKGPRAPLPSTRPLEGAALKRRG